MSLVPRAGTGDEGQPRRAAGAEQAGRLWCVARDDHSRCDSELHLPAVRPDHDQRIAWLERLQVAEHSRDRWQPVVAVDDRVARLSRPRAALEPADAGQAGGRGHRVSCVEADAFDWRVYADLFDDQAPYGASAAVEDAAGRRC